jgi:hypothetical protein
MGKSFKSDAISQYARKNWGDYARHGGGSRMATFIPLPKVLDSWKGPTRPERVNEPAAPHAAEGRLLSLRITFA